LNIAAAFKTPVLALQVSPANPWNLDWIGCHRVDEYTERSVKTGTDPWLDAQLATPNMVVRARRGEAK